MSFLLLSEEDNNTLGVGFFAQVQEVTETLVLPSGTETHEFLNKGGYSILLGINHQTHWAIHANANKLVN